MCIRDRLVNICEIVIKTEFELKIGTQMPRIFDFLQSRGHFFNEMPAFIRYCRECALCTVPGLLHAVVKLTWLVLGGDPAARSHRVEQFTAL